MYHTSDRVLVVGLFHDLETALIGKRLEAVTAPASDTRASQSWNVHEWELR